MTASEPNAGQPGLLSGREAAFQALLSVLRGGDFVQVTLAKLRDDRRLDQREAALAMETALGAVRHALTIEHVLRAVARYDQRRVKRPRYSGAAVVLVVVPGVSLRSSPGYLPAPRPGAHSMTECRVLT